MTGARSATPARQPLRRAAGDRLLLGVCAGVARSLDLPALAVRLGAVALAAVALPLVLAAYVILGAIVPRDDGRVLLGGVPGDWRETLLGWSLVALVLAWFAGAEFRLEDLVWPALSSFGIFAAAVAALGLLALNQRRAGAMSGAGAAGATSASDAAMSGTGAAGAGQAAGATVAATTPVAPGGGEGVAGQDVAGEGERVAGEDVAGEAGGAGTAEADEAARDDTAATLPFAEAPTAVQPPPAAPRGLSLGTIGAAVLLIAGAIAFLLDATGAIDPDASEVAIGLAVAAALAGAGAIAGAVLGRRGVIVLLALGTALAATAAGVGLVSDELDDGVGFRTQQPATAAQIPDTYRLGVGDLDIDLRGTDLPAGVTTVRADVRLGDLTVLVPRGVRVESIGPTEVSGVARVNDALPQPKPAGKRRRRQRERPAAAPRTVRIDADVGEGEARVVLGAP